MLLTKLAQTVHKAKFLLDDHSTTILTAAGVGGTVATAVLTGRASIKATRIIDDARINREQQRLDEDRPIPNLTRMEEVRLVWRLYLPPVASGITTITSIIVANKISSKKIAALAVAGGISERALQEYKEKVVEKLGVRQDRALRDEIAQDRVNKNPPSSKEIILAGTGEVLCYDMTTGRYFQSTVEDIKRAENKLNHQMFNHMSASLSEFYDEIGLPPTSYTDSVGWNINDPIEVQFSTTLSPDGRPCIAIDFLRPPTAEYTNLYG